MSDRDAEDTPVCRCNIHHDAEAALAENRVTDPSGTQASAAGASRGAFRWAHIHLDRSPTTHQHLSPQLLGSRCLRSGRMIGEPGARG